MLLTGLTLLLLGAALATRGLVGRRVGDEPRCRKCKYNLTGVESNKCPECGRLWTPGSAARGLRFTRKRPLALGVVLLLLGGALTAAIATGYLQKTNWFTHLPTSWIIPFATRGNTNAFTAIADRFDNDKLTASDLPQLIEAALTVQADPQLRATTQDWIDLLARLEARGKLTTQQRDRFYSQMVMLDVTIRSPLSRADYMEGEVHRRWRAPKTRYLECQIEAVSATLDGRPLDFRPMTLGFDNLLNARGSRILQNSMCPLILGPFPPESPGIHKIELNCRSEIRSLETRGREKIWAGNLTPNATIKIADAREPAAPAIADDAETIQRLIDSLAFRVTAVGHGNPKSLYIDWQLLKPSPCDAWLEIRTRPRRSRLLGFFDFTETIYLPQGRHDELPTELGSIESSKLAPGDKLTLWLYSQDRDNSERGVGATRLKPGVLLGQIQVPIQPAATPAPAAGT